jgi:hypothetical protein
MNINMNTGTFVWFVVYLILMTASISVFSEANRFYGFLLQATQYSLETITIDAKAKTPGKTLFQLAIERKMIQSNSLNDA